MISRHHVWCYQHLYESKWCAEGPIHMLRDIHCSHSPRLPQVPHYEFQLSATPRNFRHKVSTSKLGYFQWQTGCIQWKHDCGYARFVHQNDHHRSFFLFQQSSKLIKLGGRILTKRTSVVAISVADFLMFRRQWRLAKAWLKNMASNAYRTLNPLDTVAAGNRTIKIHNI